MKFFGSFFDLSTAERKGGVVLLILILVGILIRFMLPSESTYESLTDQYSDQFSDFVHAMESESEVVSSFYENSQYAPFYPDSLSVNEWKDLGFSTKQAETILSFKKAIGGFHSEEELLKCFVIDSTDIRLWGDALLFNQANIAQKEDARNKQNSSKTISNKEQENSYSYPKKVKVPHLEINSADSTELIMLPGIGPITAGRIIRFRDLLGGFYSIEQLREVWGIREENLQKAIEYLSVDPALIVKPCINDIDEQTLSDHPYIRPKIAKIIVNYRKQHGPFKSIKDMKNCVVVTDSIYGKIEAYFTSCGSTRE